jgi:predicted nucleic acid-binding Zn ribbon protein
VTAERLQSALGFTPADLEANRAGRLSDTQQEFMNVQSKRGRAFILGMGGFFVVFVIIIVTVVVPKMNSSSTDSTSGSSSAVPPWVIAAVLAVVALIVLRSVLKGRKRVGQLATGAVQSVEGPAKTKAVMRGNVTDDVMLVPMGVYRLKVGKVTFALSTAKQLSGFDDGVSYRCFYVKGTLPVLISAEEI